MIFWMVLHTPRFSSETGVVLERSTLLGSALCSGGSIMPAIVRRLWYNGFLVCDEATGRECRTNHRPFA